MLRHINDLIALILLVVIIPALWLANSLKVLSIDGVVLGATISGWTLILQYYFRKAPGVVTPSTPTNGSSPAAPPAPAAPGVPKP